jgi:hypothetical protein
MTARGLVTVTNTFSYYVKDTVKNTLVFNVTELITIAKGFKIPASAGGSLCNDVEIKHK